MRIEHQHLTFICVVDQTEAFHPWRGQIGGIAETRQPAILALAQVFVINIRSGQ